MIKILIMPLILGFSMSFIPNVYATRPYPTKILKGTKNAITVKLQPEMEEALIIINDNSKVSKIFSIEELKLKIMPIISTAGLIWYQNSIVFFNKKEQYLIIRLKENEMVIVELKSNTLLYNISKKLKKEIDKIVSKNALTLLSSKDAHERQTGAIICGQIKLKKSIPNLIKLLTDEEYYKTNVPKEWTKVYFVRKAAKEALEAMGKKARYIITEEFE